MSIEDIPSVKRMQEQKRDIALLLEIGRQLCSPATEREELAALQEQWDGAKSVLTTALTDHVSITLLRVDDGWGFHDWTTATFHPIRVRPIPAHVALRCATSKRALRIYAIVYSGGRSRAGRLRGLRRACTAPGGYGTSIATALGGGVRLEPNPPVPATKFVEGSGKAFNTIPPNDFSYFEMVNKLVQLEPAISLDPELLGQLAAIGIVKGKPFNPDARMKKILTDAVAVGNAAGRALNWRASEYPGWSYYPGSMWANMLWEGGFNFETPPPMITKEGFKPLPPTGARTLNSRTAFYYAYTMDSPGMIMRVPNVGSQYLMGFLDADKNSLDGGKTYTVTLPKDIPAGKFWSFTLYDNQTRSMLQTPQRFPRAGSQTFPSPAGAAPASRRASRPGARRRRIP